MATHDLLLKDFFPPEVSGYLSKACNRGDNERGVFHRQQLLFVCKEACEVCAEQGLDPLSTPFLGGFGVVLLMANDLLPSRFSVPQGDVTGQIINVMADLIPVTEASGFNQPIHKIIRSYFMLNKFMREGSGIAVHQVFESATGMRLQTYQALCFAAITRYFDMSLQKYKANPAEFVLNAGWFRRMSLDQALIEPFLDEMSSTMIQFRECLTQHNAGRNDFTCFRAKPLVREQGNMWVIDMAFLADKVETGPFWIVNKALPAGQRVNWHALWGEIFESYMNWLITESVDPELNRIYPNPKYASSGGEVCDAIMLCGNAALILEYKGSTFTAKAKYGTDPQALKEEIEKKLVQTEEDEPKGLRQLAMAIERIFRKEQPEKIEGLDLSNVSKIFPVLITRDDLGHTLVMNAYLSRRFRTLLRKKQLRKLTVTPLFCLSAQDLEKICGYLKHVRLSELLEERYKRDPILVSSFWTVENRIIDHLGVKRSEAFWEGFKVLGRMINQELFPRGERSA